ncbi:hypothetical protein LguiA_020078 [Lonicera macranthoides]
MWGSSPSIEELYVHLNLGANDGLDLDLNEILIEESNNEPKRAPSRRQSSTTIQQWGNFSSQGGRPVACGNADDLDFSRGNIGNFVPKICNKPE